MPYNHNLRRSFVRPRTGCAGGSLVEAAMTMPLFILFVLFIIDIGRFFFVYIFLNFASHNAVNLASKLPIDADLYASGVCLCEAPPPNACVQYTTYIEMLNAKAMEGALRVASPSDSDGWVRLVPFEHYYHSPQDCGPRMIVDFAFLRPGEKVKGYPGEPNEFEYFHPTRPFGSEPGLGWPGNNENWSGVLSSHPLEVRIEALFRPVTPFVPRLRIVASQYAFGSSDIFDESTSGVHPTPTPPTPTPTEPPTPTPNPCDSCINPQGQANCSFCVANCEGCFYDECPEQYQILFEECIDHSGGLQDLYCEECWLEVTGTAGCGPPCGNPCDDCGNPQSVEVCVACVHAGCECGGACAGLFEAQCNPSGSPISCNNCVNDLGLPAGHECVLPECGDLCDYYCEGPTQSCGICLAEECQISDCSHECVTGFQQKFNECRGEKPLDCEASCLGSVPDVLSGCELDLNCPQCADANFCPPEGSPGSLVIGEVGEQFACLACASICGCVNSCYAPCYSDKFLELQSSLPQKVAEVLACEHCVAETLCAQNCGEYDPCVEFPQCHGDITYECGSEDPGDPFCQTCGSCCQGGICGGGQFGI